MGSVIREGETLPVPVVLPVGNISDHLGATLVTAHSIVAGRIDVRAEDGALASPIPEPAIPASLIARIPHAQEPESEAHDHALEWDAQREQATQQGFEQGYRQGEVEGRDAWDRDVARLSSLIGEIDTRWRERLDDVEDLVAEAIFAGVVRVIGDQMVTREGVASIAATVLEQAKKGRGVLTVHLSPDDFNFLGEEGRHHLVGREPNRRVTVAADARVKLGGCLVESERGSLDGRLEMQLERFKEALLDARRHSPN